MHVIARSAVTKQSIFLRKNLLTEDPFQRKNVIILGDMVRKR